MILWELLKPLNPTAPTAFKAFHALSSHRNTIAAANKCKFTLKKSNGYYKYNQSVGSTVFYSNLLH